MRLKDKVAIVTGGAQGIGRSFAFGFAKEGAKVVIADIDSVAAKTTVDTLKKGGAEALSTETDVSSPESTEEMIRKTIDHFGRVDILVNNAALSKFKRPRLPFWEIDLNEWDRVMAVNIKGTFLCIRAVFPYMKAQGGGKIINIASTTFIWGAPIFAHYVASKGGIIGLTRAIAREVGEYNINVNSIAPGGTLTEDPSDKEAVSYRSGPIQKRSIQRMEYPEDVVGSAIFLASSDSDFITGQLIVVDGGNILH